MLLGRLEIHTALPNLKIDVRIVAQVYWVAILYIERDKIGKALLITQETEWIEWFCPVLLIPSILEWLSEEAFIREGHLIQFSFLTALGRGGGELYYIRGVYLEVSVHRGIYDYAYN